MTVLKIWKARFGFLMACVYAVLMVCVCPMAQGQVQPFKVGDAVDMNVGYKWVSCTVSSPFDGSGYTLKCGSSTGYRSNGDAKHLRAHQVGTGGPMGESTDGAPVVSVAAVPEVAVAGQADMTKFKVGDAVEVITAGFWRSCTIAAPLTAGGYDVHCGPLNLRAKADAEHIRAALPNAAAARAQAETMEAMKNRPKGNGIGAKYGTREPASCANRGGPLNSATARQYFICDAEGEKAGYMYLVANVFVEVSSPRAFNWNQDSASTAIDTAQPVYDLHGSFNQFVCSKPTPVDNDFARTHNCGLYEQHHAEGRCFRNTFGEWHCLMADTHRSAWPNAKNQLPPGEE